MKVLLNNFCSFVLVIVLNLLEKIHGKKLSLIVLTEKEREIVVYSLRQFKSIEYKSYLTPPEKMDYGLIANGYHHKFEEKEVQDLTSRLVLIK